MDSDWSGYLNLPTKHMFYLDLESHSIATPRNIKYDIISTRVSLQVFYERTYYVFEHLVQETGHPKSDS